MFKKVSVCAFGVSLLAAPGVHAQEAPPEPQAAGTTQLEEIIVTAQKRSEQAQDVPISISTFSGGDLVQLGVADTTALSTIVPGLKFTQSSTAGTPFLRGVGHNIGSVGDESPIATYLDGVYTANTAGNVLSLRDIERIEVLKGPQGTLFGRNAAGGVVQIVTRNPQHDPELDMDIGYGNFGKLEANLFATTGLSDTLATSLTFRAADQDEGWGFNPLLNREMFVSNSVSVRNKWLWTPSEGTEILLSGFYDRRRTYEGIALTLLPGVTGIDGQSVNIGYYNNEDNIDPFAFNRQYRGGLTVRQEIGDLQLVAIGGYHHFASNLNLDQDGSRSALVNFPARYRERTWTGEVQLLSPDNGPFSWILGAFYMNDISRARIVTTGALVANQPSISTSVQHTDSYAAFAQASLELMTDTTLTLGLRYTSDHRELDGSIANAVTTTARTQERTWNKLTWRIALDHKFSDAVMGYVQFNRGFKSGIFNLNSPLGTPANPEVLDAYEIGLKSEWFDRRLRLNAAAFYYDYKDIQLRATTAGSTVLYNAQGRIKGLDVDFEAVPVPNLTLTGGFELLDPDYTDFPNAPFSSRRPTGGNLIVPGDASDNQLIQASKFSASLGARLEIPSEIGNFEVNGNYTYSSKFFWDPDNRLFQSALSLFGGSIGWTSRDEGVSVRLWGRNLTNKKYPINETGTSAVGDLYTPAAPRTYGITVGTQF